MSQQEEHLMKLVRQWFRGSVNTAPQYKEELLLCSLFKHQTPRFMLAWFMTTPTICDVRACQTKKIKTAVYRKFDEVN